VWEYDAVADSWTQKTSMPTTSGRDEAFVFVVDNKAYIGGGNTPGQLPSFWEFDPAAGANGAWTKRQPILGLPMKRYLHSHPVTQVMQEPDPESRTM
jgi:hypothetical protein